MTHDPGTWLSLLRSGSTRFIMAVNMNLLPQPWQDLHRYAGYENTTFPVRPTLRIQPQPEGSVIYDVLNARRLTPRVENGQWLVEADMSVFPGHAGHSAASDQQSATGCRNVDKKAPAAPVG